MSYLVCSSIAYCALLSFKNNCSHALGLTSESRGGVPQMGEPPTECLTAPPKGQQMLTLLPSSEQFGSLSTHSHLMVEMSRANWRCNANTNVPVSNAREGGTVLHSFSKTCSKRSMHSVIISQIALASFALNAPCVVDVMWPSAPCILT